MILGLHGKMGAGKNEAARRLALSSVGGDLDVIEVSFAAKLKQSAAALLGCSVADLEAFKNEPTAYVTMGANYSSAMSAEALAVKQRYQTVRSFLQRYGTEAHRDIFGKDFWLDAALPFIGSIHYEHALYVATDVRFPNEAQRIRALGGAVVRIIGPNEHAGGHASEQTIDGDFTINNQEREDDYASLDAQLREVVRRVTTWV